MSLTHCARALRTVRTKNIFLMDEVAKVCSSVYSILLHDLSGDEHATALSVYLVIFDDMRYWCDLRTQCTWGSGPLLHMAGYSSTRATGLVLAERTKVQSIAYPSCIVNVISASVNTFQKIGIIC